MLPEEEVDRLREELAQARDREAQVKAFAESLGRESFSRTVGIGYVQNRIRQIFEAEEPKVWVEKGD